MCMRVCHIVTSLQLLLMLLSRMTLIHNNIGNNNNNERYACGKCCWVEKSIFNAKIHVFGAPSIRKSVMNGGVMWSLLFLHIQIIDKDNNNDI